MPTHVSTIAIAIAGHHNLMLENSYCLIINLQDTDIVRRILLKLFTVKIVWCDCLMNKELYKPTRLNFESTIQILTRHKFHNVI